ncbi:MAG: hypothetical protein Q8L24_02885 [bacterium]|nr:hypothetical protein [bacterium]
MSSKGRSASGGKKILIAIAFSSFACWTYAEESVKKTDDSVFDIEGNARVKQFIINQEPDQIKLDYRGNDDHADQELELNARARVCDYLYFDINPYFWRSDENKISRIGLKAEAKVSLGII